MPKLKSLLRDIIDRSSPASQDPEDPEIAMHRHVEHALTNRFIVDCAMEKGMVALSFGKGKGEKATYSPHGFVMSVETAVDLIYKMREMMLATGHPDPFPPTVTVVEAGRGGPGGPGPGQGNAGGGPGGPAVPAGWSMSGKIVMPGGDFSVTLARNTSTDRAVGIGKTETEALRQAVQIVEEWGK